MGRNDWISVDDRLPDEYNLQTWILDDYGNIEIDDWMDNRGETLNVVDSGGVKAVIASGWYMNCDANILYWMPIERPELPDGFETVKE